MRLHIILLFVLRMEFHRLLILLRQTWNCLNFFFQFLFIYLFFNQPKTYFFFSFPETNNCPLFSKSQRDVTQFLSLPLLKFLQVLRCHTISFVFQVKEPTIWVSHTPPFWITKSKLKPQSKNADFSNAGIFRISTSGQTIVLTACFEEDVTYLFCSLRIFEPEPVHFSFSTQSAV